MSFSLKVKEELSRQSSSARHCQIAELAALLSGQGRVLTARDESRELRFQTENKSVARKYFTLLKKTYNIETVITIRDGASYIKKGNVYAVEIKEEPFIQKILQSTKLTYPKGVVSSPLSLANPVVVQKNCCKRAFIRGAFLASGSITDPRKGYHFEIVCASEEKAVQLQEIICSFEAEAKIVQRKKSYVVYMKEGAQIVEILAVMEANIALMDLENIRILKEMRNSVNRKVNCETANINKTVNAAVKQIEDIRLIESTIGFESLKEGLAKVAALRLQYPEATLKELGMMLTPQVGKSGVNHRLRKLSELAENLRGCEEELL